MPAAGGLESTQQLVKPRMEALDRLMAETLAAETPCVAEMLDYAARYSGKRLRPALIFVVADLCGEIKDAHVKLGAVVELIHMATLVHDDVLDQATLRRNTEAVNIRWNNKDAILLGDIMFARAIRLLVDVGSIRALERLTETVAIICEGEIHQNQLSGQIEVDEATYTRIIGQKTASLYAASCELGALLAGASPDLVKAFESFGESLGIAFQIIDDCLDLSGSEEVVGKSLGTDISNGKMTLPLIHLLGTLRGDERLGLETLIRARNAGSEEITGVRKLLT
ncbi:MAG: polyprenyl synthetase family protein, partial [Planctomycetes bacterium]|nr:polyprenyl synthetase family protein [Planctomycetota bacterium]